MKNIVIYVSLALLASGCSSSPEPPPDPAKEFKKKFKVIKTVRHPLPEFKDSTDNGQLYIINLSRKKPGAN